MARRKYSRLREVHHLQLVFIRKFSDDICATGQFYRTQMDHQCQYDEKRHFKQISSKKIDEDEEQIEKTLNFFDSILDPYLNDQEISEVPKSKCSIFVYQSAILTDSITFRSTNFEWSITALTC